MLAERVATHRGLISGVATSKKPFVSGVAWRGVAWRGHFLPRYCPLVCYFYVCFENPIVSRTRRQTTTSFTEPRITHFVKI